MGQFPPRVRINGSVRWRETDIDDFVAGRWKPLPPLHSALATIPYIRGSRWTTPTTRCRAAALCRRSGTPHTHAIRLHRGGRGFVAICTRSGSDWREHCAEPPGLFADLPPLGSMDEHFISVNAFKGPGRTISTLFGLRACFLDLDYHREAPWRDMRPEDVWFSVQGLISNNGIPMPTMVVASGRGLHVYWNFPHGLSGCPAIYAVAAAGSPAAAGDPGS